MLGLKRIGVGFLTLLVVTVFGTGTAWAQVQFEAIAGEPFGVLRVSASVASAETRFEVYDDDDRVLYPAYQEAGQPVRRLLRNLLKVDGPRMVTHYFLFKGDGPLTVRLHSPKGEAHTVRVGHGSAAHDRLLDEWWHAYRAPTRYWNKADDYPPEVETYLTTMLARRLRLPIEEQPLSLFGNEEFDSVLGPLMGSEAARINLQRATILRGVDTAEATLPLPDFDPPPLEIDDPPADVDIEAIASHVPAECFYVRFGNFDNYRWLGTLMDHAGGELRNLLSVRGVDYNMKAAMERQIALRETELAKLLGPLVIADVAIIGTDTFFREGASFGILFEARGDALAQDFVRQRTNTLEANPDAREEMVEIAGQQVSLLTTPDNRIRSFYVADGDYHFVTTSRHLAERFLQAGAGDRPLAAEKDFRGARQLMPTKRRDTAFVYLSEAFLREISGAKYRIEMNRRLQAVVDIELVQLAQLAARAEGRPSATIDDLIAGHFLPKGFGRRPDGSRTELAVGTGQAGESGLDAMAFDTLRGPRGSFLPAADIEVTNITPAELRDYEQFAGPVSQQWQRVNPVVIGIKRRRLEGGKKERVTIDAHVTPLAVKNYDWLASYFGPADRQQLAPMAADLLSFEAALNGQHIFGGLRDLPKSSGGERRANGPLVVPKKMLESPISIFLSTAPRDYLTGYLGAAPDTGSLVPLVPGNFGPPDAAGFSRAMGLLGPVWRRGLGDMGVYSYHPDLLAEATDQVQVIETERPAQLRLHAGDMSGSDWGRFVDLLGYASARRTSAGNAKFLNSLTRQLHVPRDKCLPVAERLLGARMVCPLGGEFTLVEGRRQASQWASTVWATEDPAKPVVVPANYRAPPLSWMRGLEAEVVMAPGQLTLHAQIDMQFDETTTPKAELIPPPPADDEASLEELPTEELPELDKPDASDT